MFEDAVGNDYRLVMASAPTDAGAELAEVTSGRLGIPRLFGAAFDIGAYEWTDVEPPRWARAVAAKRPPPTLRGLGGSGGQSTSGPSGGSAGLGSDGTLTGGVGSSGDTDTDSGGAVDGDDGGCGCTSAPGPWGWSVTALTALAFFRRRRR